ncbi:MAG: glycosyltransferase family 4 protein [Gaiellaceae bacterium]
MHGRSQTGRLVWRTHPRVDEHIRRTGLTIVSHARVAPHGAAWLTKNRLAEIFGGLCDLGWRPRLVAREAPGADYLTSFVPPGVEVIPLRSSPQNRTFARELLGFHALIRRSSHVLAFMPSLVGAFAVLVGGRRVIVYAGSAWELQERSRWRTWLERLVARRAAGVVAHGEALQALYRASGAQVQAAVPLVEAEVASLLASREWAEKNAHGEALRVLFVGSISHWKGVPTLLAALAAVSEPIEARFVGAAGDAESVAALVSFLETSESTSWLGYLDWPELREIYRWADVLVLPSRSEGFPRVAYEATAFGAALLVTPVGGIPHRLRDGRDAFFVSPDDEVVLAAALRRFAQDRDLAPSLNRSARAAMAPLFADETPAEQFDRLLLASEEER